MDPTPAPAPAPARDDAEGSVDPEVEIPAAVEDAAKGGLGPAPVPTGWRSAHEVVAFLRARGAKVASLVRSVEGEWAALNSDGELSSTEVYDSEREDGATALSPPAAR